MSDQKLLEANTIPRTRIYGVPDVGWRVSLDFECSEFCRPFTHPSLYQIYKFPFLLSYAFVKSITSLYRRLEGKKPIVDLSPHKPMYGCPIGGIGAGTIGRGYRGEFCNFQMVPGIYESEIIQADAFIVNIRKEGDTVYQTVLTGRRTSAALSKWQWTFPLHRAIYHALYPRAWTVYDIPEHSVRLTCVQVSPVIPNNYKDSSFPMAAFAWTVENNSSEDLDISITFTFQSGVRESRTEPCSTETFEVEGEQQEIIKGVLIQQRFNNMPCTYAIACREMSGTSASLCTYFDTNGDGCEIWDPLNETGALHATGDSKNTSHSGAGVAVSLDVHSFSNSRNVMEFSLVWNMPSITFGDGNRKYKRRFSRWFGDKTGAAEAMSVYCIRNRSRWEEEIEEWQQPILRCRQVPVWYRALLFNELYYVSDGGSVWLDPSASDADNPLAEEYGKFAYLEGQSYRLYNTVDVHFYASFALTMLWPKLQLSLQYDIGKAISSEDLEYRVNSWNGSIYHRNPLYFTPHDMGTPGNEPWEKVNDHLGLSAATMKDLNTKFVLQVYRDYHVTGDMKYLSDMYPLMKAVMKQCFKWIGGDGLIHNGWYPDQTFALWLAVGPSAYICGLWLAALRVMSETARILGEQDDAVEFNDLLSTAVHSYNRILWNGKYYNYDSSPNRDSLMSMQLAGQWYLKASGISDDAVFDPKKVSSALHAVFHQNVLGVKGGSYGALNGTRANGEPESAYIHSEEFFTGVTYGVAAQMIQENMLEEAFQTAWGNYNTCWELMGFQFKTPESLSLNKVFRYPGYMRALAVWSMQYALEKYHPHLFEQ